MSEKPALICLRIDDKKRKALLLDPIDGKLWWLDPFVKKEECIKPASEDDYKRYKN